MTSGFLKNVVCRLIIAPGKRLRRYIIRLADQASFDWRYGTDTARFVTLESIDVNSPHKYLGADYQPSSATEFQRILAAIPRPLKNYTFVDFGCGKGRTLLLAARAGFHRVVGVEFSPDLVKTAQENIEKFRRHTSADMQIFCQDAAEFTIPPGDCVLYFYNPFRGKVMEAVVENIRAAHAQQPRTFYIALWHCEKSYYLFDALAFVARKTSGGGRRNWLTEMLHQWVVYGPTGR